MTIQTLTLADFLLARIAEDEGAAREVIAEPWFSTPSGVHSRDPETGVIRWIVSAHVINRCEQDYLARFDPMRVLAECEAKRRIVELHNPCDDWSYGDASWCPELRALAQPYADHPDFRQEWRADA